MSNPHTEGQPPLSRDLIDKASALGINSSQFQSQLLGANQAYDRIVQLGPFYGSDIKGQNPSFKTSSSPLKLPAHLRSVYEGLGQDIALLGKTLPTLPAESQALLGKDWSPLIPFLWRIDSIIDENGQVLVNEVQISDGCDGRMTGLQMAYGLATPEDSTPGHTVNYLVNRFQQRTQPPKIAFIRHDVSGSPYTSNARRMHEYLSDAARDRVTFTLADKTAFESTDWKEFDGIINYAFVKVKELEKHGIAEQQILCPGDAAYIGSKAVFALLHDAQLDNFWRTNLGSDSLNRLKDHFIKSAFVKDSGDIKNAKDSGAVVKVFDAERLSAIGAARGVFGPWDLADESWNEAFIHLDMGSGLIVQDFIRPQKLPVLLRSNNGRNLQRAELHNKIAAKYVESPQREMQLTGLEATLGESEKPAGKGCCITAVQFEA